MNLVLLGDHFDLIILFLKALSNGFGEMKECHASWMAGGKTRSFSLVLFVFLF